MLIISFFPKKRNANNVIILFKYLKDVIKLIYANSYKKYSNHRLTGFMIDYKEQFFIIGLKQIYNA